MGTTIRRQPVTFDIPAAPNYKFLNITNFRGLDVSSNPFELATNTSSDCLNVYVDETNTLTTRPRLEKKIATPLNGTHVGTYNLHDGYLLHYITDNGPEMWVLKNGQLSDKSISGTIPTNKCQYFEQGDKIYLLDGERYMVISDNTLTDVEGYVPTTAIVALDGIRKNVDSLNLLSDKYVEKYYWDGISELPAVGNDVIDVKNNYYTEHEFSSNFIPTQCYADYTAFGYYSDTNEMVYVEFDPKKELKYTTINHTYSDDIVFMRTEKGFWQYANTTLTRYIYKDYSLSTLSYTASGKITYCETSPNGSYAIIVEGGYYYIVQVDVDLTSAKITVPQPAGSSVTLYKHTMSDNYLYWLGANSDETKLYLYKSQLSKNLLFTEFDVLTDIHPDEFLVTSDDSLIVLTTYRAYTSTPIKFITYTNLDVSTRTTQTTYLPGGTPKLSDDKIIYGGTYTTKNPAKTWYFPDYTNLEKYQILQIGDHYIEPDNYNWLYTTEYFNQIFKDKYVVIFNRYHNDIKNKYFIFNTSTEPLINHTKKLSQKDLDYSDWLERRNALFNTQLMTRFDNNYWFASKNKYYRSQNNDPTYFPITEYNELGDSNEEITGFNLANDTTLIAYKKNKIYLIQPFTSSLDTTEYTITESKNTVGNTAIGAPIVTTLTEIPLQINNDGVYGLSQLSNVSATERIADLISEPINERWLNIDDALITNAKTLNRLYWTYIILPDETHERTMIYLLDNRSNSWYYWEFPIIVSDAFVKDNITEFADIYGNIYYLTSTDIENKNFDSQLITEYYDEGRQLIPWHWQSQVLFLGTMNYSKRLVNTTFILTDTDAQDGYGLKYNFKVFRKLASQTPEKEITGDLNLVRSTTKKTNISKFGFIQLRLSNITEESQGTEPEKAFRNNKLRLVGLGLKYVLLEGLIR